MIREIGYFNQLLQESNEAFDIWVENVDKKKQLQRQLNRRNGIVRKIDFVVDELDREFSEKAKLDPVDISFVFLGASLQVMRQVFLTSFIERQDHRSAECYAESSKKRLQSMKVRNDQKLSSHYYASIEEIILKPGVPYDITADRTELKAHLSGVNHRNRTWGHDPVFGYVFGTANILTNTLTYSAVSGPKLAEIGTIVTKHVGSIKAKDGRHILAMTELASTKEMFQYSIERLQREPIAVGAAILKQYAHIRSDEYSKLGLPFPGTNLAPNLSKYLTECGLDLANTKMISKQGVCAVFVNYIIRVLYWLHLKKQNQIGESSIVQIKTNRILTLSNVIEEFIVTAYALTTQDYRKLDIGNFIVLIHQIAMDLSFRKEMERCFIENRLYEMMEEY